MSSYPRHTRSLLLGLAVLCGAFVPSVAQAVSYITWTVSPNPVSYNNSSVITWACFTGEAPGNSTLKKDGTVVAGGTATYEGNAYTGYYWVSRGSYNTGAMTTAATFRGDCSAGGSNAFQTTVLNVTGRILSFTADSTSLSYNTGTTLRWTIGPGTTGWGSQCHINGTPVGTGSSGSYDTGALTTTSSYGFTCHDNTLGWIAPPGVTAYIYGPPNQTRSITVSVAAPASCTFNGASVAHNNSVTAYQSSSVAYGSSCVSQSRTCTNGSLSGSYAYSSCEVASPGSCTFNGSTVAHNNSVTAYQSSSVAYGSSCVSQSRTCSNGSLSGSYAYSSCEVGSCPNGLSYSNYPTCTCPAGHVQEGASCVTTSGSITSFSADTISVPYNTGTTLRWTLEPGSSGWSVWGCYINSTPVGSASSDSMDTGPLTADTSYGLTCHDSVHGWVTPPGAAASPLGPPAPASITIDVGPPDAPSASLSLSPSTVNYGGAAALSWSSANTSSCTLYNPSNAAVSSGTSGSYTTPGLTAASNTYRLTCSGPGGSVSQTATVAVNPPVLSFVACSAAGTCTSPWVNPGKSAYLTYSAQSVGSCSITTSGGSTIFSNTSGSAATTPALSTDTTYVFSCTGAPSPTPISRTVSVVPACAAPSSSSALRGWAWSEHAGWLSLDCTTSYQALNWPSGYDTQNWGLSVGSGGAVSGYAWSDKLGWVKFGGLSGFPTGSGTSAQNAALSGSGSSVVMRGWARACGATQSNDCSTMMSGNGWDGWISLGGTTGGSGSYGVSLAPNSAYAPEVSGAWMGDPAAGGVGWLAFHFDLSSLPPPACTISAQSFQAGESTTLNYSSTNSTGASINQGIGTVAPNTSGTRTTPAIYLPTLYTMSVSGFGGNAGCNVLVTPANTEAYGCLSVNSPTCAPPQHQVRINPDATASLFWDVENATQCTLSGNNGQSWTGLGDTGTRTTEPITRRTIYTLSCDGTVVDRATITLTPSFIER